MTFDPVSIKAIDAFNEAFTSIVHDKDKAFRFLRLIKYDIEAPSPNLANYGEYLPLHKDMTDEEIRQVGSTLGAGAAILYNACVKDSYMRLKHRHVSSINNLKVNSIISDGGIEIDREGKGWISFRLLYSSY